ncbi:MAG: hypothetical protein ACE5IK_14635, partial [Acidobacteriota bacterium]
MWAESSLHRPARGRLQAARILIVAGLLAGLATPPAWAGQSGPRNRPGAADLVVGSQDIEMSADGRTLTVTVSNRGTATAPGVLVRIADRPLLGAGNTPGPYFPRHHLLRGERGLVLWPEHLDSAPVIRVRWQGNDAADRFAGRFRLEDSEGTPLAPRSPRATGSLPSKALAVEPGGWVSWNATTGKPAAGFDVAFDPASRPAQLTVERPAIDGAPNLHQIYVGNWWLPRFVQDLQTDDQPSPIDTGHPEDPEPPAILGPIHISLDDPRLTAVAHPAPGFSMETRLASLDAGAQGRAVFVLPEAPREVFVVVDPDDELREQREGNNAATWRPDDGRVMVSLHTHSSLSEGYASFDTQMDLLTRSGYDAVFWTDHDWRIIPYEPLDVGSFEGDPEGILPAGVVKRQDEGLEATLSVTEQRSTDGTHSLRLEGRRVRPFRGPPVQEIWALRAPRARMIRSLAENLSVAFDLFPDPDNPFDAEFLLVAQLSDQPHVRRFLRYRVDILPDALARPQIILPAPVGPEAVAHVSVRPGRWTRIVLPVSRHAQALFPAGEDNNLSGLHVGMRLRSASARFDLDRFTFETARRGFDLLERQQHWGEAYPAIASHVTNEISFYIPHFNVFTKNPFLLDYDAIPMARYAQEARRRTTLADGALSINHPMGFNRPYEEKTVEGQLQARLFGADLVEVGYRWRGFTDLAGHLAFWDRALAAGIPASGIGVSDAHGAGRGNGFERDENNFATWVEADSPSVDDIVDGLLAGRVTFGDPLLFSGTLELNADQTARAGDIVIGAARPHRAAYRGHQLLPGGRLDLVADGRVVSSIVLDDQGDGRGEFETARSIRALRLASWGPAGEPVGFTNAIMFADKLPEETTPASRLRVRLDHGELTGRGRFRVETLGVGARPVNHT